MGKTALFAKIQCQNSQNILRFFKEEGEAIDIVIIEHAVRKRFSSDEKKYRRAHDEFNQIEKKYSPFRRFLKFVWEKLVPKTIQNWVFLTLPSIPVLKKQSVEFLARQMGIKVCRVKRHSSKETDKILRENNVDYVIFGSSNWIIKSPVVQSKSYKIINIHPAKLPNYKGLDSLFYTVLNKDQIGSTAFFLDRTIDGGEILKFFPYTPQPNDSLVKIQKRMAAQKPNQFLEVLRELRDGKLTPIPQISDGFICSPLTVEKLLEAEREFKRVYLSNEN